MHECFRGGLKSPKIVQVGKAGSDRAQFFVPILYRDPAFEAFGDFYGLV
jgi:hypothetical protein